MSDNPTTIIIGDIQNLRRDFETAASELADAAKALRSPGYPPSEHLVERLGKLRTAFEQLAERVGEQAEALCYDTRGLAHLDEIEACAEKLGPLRQRADQIEHAKGVLDDASRLTTSHLNIENIVQCALKWKKALCDDEKLERTMDQAESDLRSLSALLELIKGTCNDRTGRRTLHGQVAERFGTEVAFEAVEGGIEVGPVQPDDDTPDDDQGKKKEEGKPPAQEPGEPVVDSPHIAMRDAGLGVFTPIRAGEDDRADRGEPSSKPVETTPSASTSHSDEVSKEPPPAERDELTTKEEGTSDEAEEVPTSLEPDEPSAGKEKTIDQAEEVPTSLEPDEPTTGKEKTIDEAEEAPTSLERDEPPTGEEGTSDEAEEVPAPPECVTRISPKPTLSTAQDPEDPPEGAPSEPQKMLWRLVEMGRLYLAALLARCLCDPSLPPPWLLRAVEIAPRVRRQEGPAGQHLQRAIEERSDQDLDLSDRVQRLLALAATLRPALVAPVHQAGLLHELRIRGWTPGMEAVITAVAEASKHGMPLNARILKGEDEGTTWRKERNELLEECGAWIETAPHKQTRFQRATAVWTRWMNEGGDLRELIEAVRNDDTDRMEEVIRKAEVFRKKWQRRVQDTDRKFHIRRNTRGNAIEGPALKEINRLLDSGIRYVFEWRKLYERQPDTDQNFRSRLAKECRDGLVKALPTARKEIESLKQSGDRRTAIACKYVDEALSDLEDLLDAKVDEKTVEVDIDLTRELELLRVPGLPLDVETGDPEAPSSEDIQGPIMSHDPTATWEEIFEAHVAFGNHETSKRLLELLRRGEKLDEETMDALSERRDAAIADRRARLEESLNKTRKIVEQATGLVLSEPERVECLEKVESIENDPDALDFPFLEENLMGIRKSIRQQIDDQKRRFHSQLENADPIASIRRRIDKALENDDLHLAHALLEMPDKGLDDVLNPSAFVSFVDWHEDLEDHLVREELDQVPEGVLDATLCGDRAWGPIDLRKHAPKDRARSKELWYAWCALREGGEDRGVTKFMDVLGFDDPEVLRISEDGSHHSMLEIETRPMSDRRTCPLPRFGSKANGRYQVVLVRRSQGIEELLGRVPDTNRAQVVLYLAGFLGSRERQELAATSRERKRSMLMVDEALVLFLLATSGNLRKTLFQCALPYSYERPYVVSGPVAPEMFYGRVRESKSIQNTDGTNLVYGGRQLGKTALLRDIEERLKADPAVVCRCIDLKARDIGTGRPLEDIWRLIARELHDVGIVKSDRAGQETSRPEIKRWLDEDEERRILLLLDESDTFLERDSIPLPNERADAGFRVLRPLKNLMEETRGRFKLVFAGLHNVQRTSRNPNSPLAHLREPLSIGPFIGKEEWWEARRLVELPLRAMGYAPESPDVAVRILSHTNYYPSLIQVFCHHLQHHMEQRIAHQDLAGPPYPIHVADVENAFRNQGLREDIRNRLIWTLRLDNRYRIIALHFMLESLDRSPRDLAEGFDLDEIRDGALGWWERGFVGRGTREDFETLLDEMIGLGVLRDVIRDRYALRSPNVVRLFGTREDIEKALEEAAQDEPPPTYEAHSFRRSSNEKPHERSPLTALQETRLIERHNGVQVVLGHRLAAVSEVPRYLEKSDINAARVDLLSSDSDERAYREWLNRSLRRHVEGVNLIVVGPDVDWQPGWVEHAVAEVKRRTSQVVLRRIVFVGGPQHAWRWAADNRSHREEREYPQGIVTLAPWSLSEIRRWIDEFPGGPGDPESIRKLADLTGGWTWLLQRFPPQAEESTQQWKQRFETLEEELRNNPPAPEDIGVLPEVRGLVDMMVDWEEPMLDSHFCDLSDQYDIDMVKHFLRYGESIELIRRAKDGYVLDDVARRVVKGPDSWL